MREKYKKIRKRYESFTIDSFICEIIQRKLLFINRKDVVLFIVTNEISAYKHIHTNKIKTRT